MKSKASKKKPTPKISNVEKHNVVRLIRKQCAQKLGKF